MKPYALYKSFRARGMTLEKLSELTKLDKTQLSAVFNGRRGAHTRKHIAPHLTADELKTLGWNAAGELVERVDACQQVPCETS